MKKFYIIYSNCFKNERIIVKLTELDAEKLVNLVRGTGLDCYAELDRNANNS